MHVTINGVSYTCEDQNLANAITSALQKHDELKGQVTADNADIAMKLAEKDQEIDTLKKAAEEYKQQVTTADQLEAAAEERANIIGIARSFDKDFDGAGKSITAIKTEILLSKCGDIKTGDSRLDNDIYVGARFDALLNASAKTDTPTGDSFMSGAAGSGSNVVKTDFESISKAAKDRTEKAIKARRNKWNPDYKAEESK